MSKPHLANGQVRQWNSSALLADASMVQNIDTYHISSHTTLFPSLYKADNNLLSKPYEQDFDPPSDCHKRPHESPLTTSVHSLDLDISNRA